MDDVAGSRGRGGARCGPSHCPYLCRDPALSAVSGVVRVEGLWLGGAFARLRVWLVWARAPSLFSVRGPGWLRVGDMMFDGVIPLGEALRPLGSFKADHGQVAAGQCREPAAAHLLDEGLGTHGGAHAG
jgi:hypothetical protein